MYICLKNIIDSLNSKQCRACFIYFSIAILSSSCGFHFKGNARNDSITENKIMLKELHIKGANQFDVIATNVKKLAENESITITPSAAWSVTINDEKLDRWQASTTQSVTTNEYYLRIRTSISIQHADITYRTINVSSEYLFQDNVNLINSKINEENIIYNELRQEIAADIFRRVLFLANNPPDCDCDESKPSTTE